MKNQKDLLAVLSFFLVVSCGGFKTDGLSPQNFTIVEVNVDPPLSVTVYAIRPYAPKHSRGAICSRVSIEEKCKLYSSIAGPASGVVLQVRPLTYPDCPIIRSEMVSERCYNTDVIHFSPGDTIVLNVRYPLNFSNYTVKMARNYPETAGKENQN